jgi:hypothetical protein
MKLLVTESAVVSAAAVDTAAPPARGLVDTATGLRGPDPETLHGISALSVPPVEPTQRRITVPSLKTTLAIAATAAAITLTGGALAAMTLNPWHPAAAAGRRRRWRLYAALGEQPPALASRLRGAVANARRAYHHR